jgi:hypothetical protein
MLIKLKSIKLTGHVLSKKKEEMYTRFLSVNPKRRDYLGDADIDGKVIMKLT